MCIQRKRALLREPRLPMDVLDIAREREVDLGMVTRQWRNRRTEPLPRHATICVRPESACLAALHTGGNAVPTGVLNHMAAVLVHRPKQQSPASRRRYLAMKVAAARLSILSNSALVLIKLVIGIVTGSVSVVAEAAHSAVDLVASIIAFLSVRVSDRPADRDHPFGHGKFENLSGMAEGALILLGGGVIVFEAVRSLLSGDRDIQTGLGLVAMGISAVANTIISRMLFRVAKQTDSAALEADAQHLATDVYTSAGVFGGLLVIKLTGLEALDPVIAIVVALLILKIGWETTAASVRQLADTGLPTSEVNRIEAILDRHPEILGHHKLRSRKSGPQREVDVHIKVDSRLSVETAHRVAHEAQDQIRSELGTAHVVIHVEPWTVADEANSK